MTLPRDPWGDSQGRGHCLTLGPSVPATALLSGPDLLKLRVYDLYYKMKPTTVDKWWKYVDDGMNGTVEVGLEHDFT